ncbi:hypothetical protein SAMN05216326_10961 [Nitrosomonas marina]|uniref:Uncharacterized protein n=1 Tax=Nitrosomonas marina TaxID=917 RepID=A0A1I0B540_9PROT|nr:hypothetical protein [Nitrosomonas marina]SET01627.1 hypothetical protein SAMN05216326_10961 [Nitrosomonas marina]
MIIKRIIGTLSVIVMLTGVSNSIAETFRGEFCWQVFSQNGEPYWKYKFGVYEKEGGHFALFGSVDYENTLSAAHGNAILLGDSVKLTIVSADREEGIEFWTETFAAKLNPSTLSGTWNVIEFVKRDGENDVFGIYQQGTIDLVSCE